MNNISINELKKASSTKDLEKIGTIENIRSYINSIIPNMEISATTYKDILDTIMFFKENLLPWSDNVFVSKQKEYIFILTKMEGNARMKALNANDELYSNKELAKKWKNKIAQIIHPDKGSSDNALIKLNKLYENMTDV